MTLIHHFCFFRVVKIWDTFQLREKIINMPLS